MLKVFLVEDECVVREGLRECIDWARYGFEFCGDAPDGELALPQIRKLRPDILITDIKMPFMDGLALSKLVCAELPETKIILISGHNDFEFAQEAIEIGVEQYLLKPVTKSSLLKTLEDVSRKIDEEREQKAYLRRFQQEGREYEQYARRKFFEQVTSGSLRVSEIYEQAKKLQIDIDAEGYTVILLTLQSRGAAEYSQTLADRLEELKNHTAFPVRTISLDLSDPASYETYAALLREEQPEVGLLINASGFGKFRAVMDTPLEVNLNMVDLNCKAVMALCQLTVPYMPSGSQIINIASVAAFQPIPYINVYGATKALVLHYSRALNRELKKQGVHVMAVCPFWTKTEFFDRAVASDEKPVVKKYIAMYKPEEIVAQAWKDAKKGKDMSKCGFKARMQALGVKILPHSMVMDTWLRQQELD